jgi:hypothetical protein
MSEKQHRKEKPALSDRQLAEELGVEQMEIYLVAARFKRGHFDPLTHLLTFTEKEADELAARLGRARKKISRPTEGDLKAIPEPGSE